MVIGASVASPVRDAMMTAARTHIDSQTIDHLDFAPALPCEHYQHPSGRYGHTGPGWALIETATCRTCDLPGEQAVVCKGWIDYTLATNDGVCLTCGTHLDASGLRIIEVLR